MITPNLIQWQRSLYNDGHKNKLNLIIHILTAPIFFGGFLLLISSVILKSLNVGFWGGGLLISAIILQGIGHSKEKERPVPFRSPIDFAARITVENTLTFWRFFFSGDYFRNLKD